MICYEYPSSIITRVVLLVCLGQSCERLMAALIGSRRKAEPRNCLVESPLQIQTTAWRVVHSGTVRVDRIDSKAARQSAGRCQECRGNRRQHRLRVRAGLE